MADRQFWAAIVAGGAGEEGEEGTLNSSGHTPHEWLAVFSPLMNALSSFYQEIGSNIYDENKIVGALAKTDDAGDTSVESLDHAIAYLSKSVNMAPVALRQSTETGRNQEMSEQRQKSLTNAPQQGAQQPEVTFSPEGVPTLPL